MKLKKLEKEQSIKLRKKGLSYREIQKIVPVSQSSLSLWLKDVPLTDLQKKRLADLSLRGQVAGAKAKRQQRLDKLALLTKEVKTELPHLIKDPFFTMGLALYWAEGNKQKPWNLGEKVSFANSDSTLVLMIREWFKKYCGVGKDDFTYRLHIHETANLNLALGNWSEILNIKPSQLSLTLKRNISKFRRVNKNYKGLVSIRVRKSTWLNRRIELWGKETAKYFLN